MKVLMWSGFYYQDSNQNMLKARDELAQNPMTKRLQMCTYTTLARNTHKHNIMYKRSNQRTHMPELLKLYHLRRIKVNQAAIILATGAWQNP